MWEPHETSIVIGLLAPGDVFVDVGANIGYYTVIAARLTGPGGRVFAFEPDPDNFRVLRANAEAVAASSERTAEVTLANAAVADAPGTATLHRSSANLGDHRFFAREGDARSVEVGVVTLDDAIPDGVRPSLIKVDTQGAEARILRGMRALRAQSPDTILLIEFWPFGFDRLDGSCEPLLDGLDAADADLLACFEESGQVLETSVATLRRWCRSILAPETRRFINILVLPRTERGRAARRRLLEPPGPVGSQDLDLSSPASDSALLPPGWSFREDWGRWIDGDAAEIVLPPLTGPDSLELTVEAHALAAPDHPVSAELTLHAEGRDPEPLGVIEADHDGVATHRFAVSPADFPRLLAFTVRGARTPRELTGADDDRRLGLGVHRLAVAPATPPIPADEAGSDA